MTRDLLGATGQVYVTYAAAQALARHEGSEPEEARRRLTELLLDARRAKQDAGSGAELYRLRSSTDRLDIQAHVSREGRLAVVVHANIRRR